MKTISAVAVGLCCASGGAQAEDWTGSRVGAAYGWSEVDIPDFNPALPGEDGVTSLFAGYDRDFGRFVLGGELEWSGSDVATTNLDFRITEVLRAKMRAGYDTGRFLPYVTLALTTFDALTENPPGDQSEQSGFGRALGFGLEMTVTGHLVLGAEVLFETQSTDPFEYLDNFGDTFEVETATLRAIWKF